MTWISDGERCRIQFATQEEIDDAVLRYWPDDNDNDEDLTYTIVKRIDGWAFVDGGEGRHTVHLHNLESRNLKKETLYMYQVGSVKGNETDWSEIYQFHTPSEGDSFEFIATGDMGTSNAVSMPNLLRVANEHRYDFIAFAGDQAYDMADFNGTKGDEYMNFVQDIYATIPVMAAPGNHEYTYNFSHYKNRFSINPYIESGFDDPTLYSFDYKSLHLVSFSSEVFFDQGSPEQIQTALHWLDQDLTKANENRHKRPWIMVFAHRPLYCSPSESEDCTWKANTMRYGRNDTDLGGLEELFLKHRVDVYICGHRHNYERTFPIAHNQRVATSYYQPPSFFQLIVGNAGNFQGTDSFENTTVPIADWSALRYEGYGFSSIKVTPTKLQISHHQSLPKDGAMGEMVDRVTVRKPRYPMRHILCDSTSAIGSTERVDNNGRISTLSATAACVMRPRRRPEYYYHD
ncbi:Metallo-dependent phosphatase-like protein [Circinella umbellata]|nr:Metallo-dependent phosphatase-like protein [Circinella umbellata]